jgi:hypothetical protein
LRDFSHSKYYRPFLGVSAGVAVLYVGYKILLRGETNKN